MTENYVHKYVVHLAGSEAWVNSASTSIPTELECIHHEFWLTCMFSTAFQTITQTLANADRCILCIPTDAPCAEEDIDTEYLDYVSSLYLQEYDVAEDSHAEEIDVDSAANCATPSQQCHCSRTQDRHACCSPEFPCVQKK